MARGKAPVTLDRGKADAAKALIRASWLSETIHVALDRLIRAERLRREVAAYRREPLTDDELASADLAVQFDLEDVPDPPSRDGGRARA